MGSKVRLRLLASLLLCISVAGLFMASLWTFPVPYHSLWKSHICACSKCLLEGQSCFTDLVKEAPNPFLSKKHRTSKEEFLWWKPIQGTKTNFTVYNSSVDQVLKMFPEFPELLGPSPDRCRSCAVVGNSGNLKGSRYGPLIDFHNIVIRINHGRTEGFEADVGTKTTHRVMYPESNTKVDKSTYLLFFPFKTPDFQWLLNQVRPDENGEVKSKIIANKDLILILNPAFIKYVHAAWLGKTGHYPSTGFLAFALSLSFCDEVSVFGFGADEDGNWDHYFEILRDKKLKTGGHPGMHEYEVIEKLHKKKIITFYRGQ